MQTMFLSKGSLNPSKIERNLEFINIVEWIYVESVSIFAPVSAGLHAKHGRGPALIEDI